MTTLEWQAYFEQNRQDRQGIPWDEGGTVPPGVRAPLAGLLRWMAGGWCWSPTPAAAAECEMNRQLLEQLADNLAPGRTVGNSSGLAHRIVTKSAIAAIRHRVDDPVVQAVCRQVLHDVQFQLLYCADSHLANSKKLALLGRVLTTATSVLCRYGTLVGSPRELVADLYRTLRLLSRVGSQPRRRGYYWPASLRVAPALDPTLPVHPVAPRTALLINPFYPKDPQASFGKHVLTPTVALTSIAGATPPEWQVRYWDENLLQGPPPADPTPAVVGITVHLTFAQRAYALADWYRARGAKVVFGGLHVVSCPDECARHADAIALGEGTQVWPQILRDVDAGKLQPVYRGDYRHPYREEPSPTRSVLPRWGFLTSASVIATRGCHNRCGFCYLATNDLHMPYQMRDVEQVIEEIYDTGEPYAVFTDNNLGSRPDYLRRLCRALRPLEIIWSAAVTIDVTDDPVLVRDMALAGCTGVFVGFESLTASNLTDAGKRTPRPDDFARRVRILHDHGIQVNGSFVLGFDHDRPDCFERTVDWIESNRLECATFHLLTPYPGTPLFQQFEEQGRLLHTDWSRYDTAHVVFRPRHMTPEELAAGYAWCYARLFSHRSIWRRRPADTSAVLPYLAMAYLYKRSNRFWHLMIRHRLTHAIWRPVIEVSRRRHLRFRRQFSHPEPRATVGAPWPAGV